MAWWDDLWWALTNPFTSPIKAPGQEVTGTETSGVTKIPPPPPKTTDDGTDESAAIARTQLKMFIAALIAVVSAPAAYVAYKAYGKSKKRKMSDKDMMMGQTIENASTQATGLLMTAIANPVFATAMAYILVQKLEDGKVITKGLGNATQGLLTVSAAGPMIQGVGQIASSAFKRGK